MTEAKRDTYRYKLIENGKVVLIGLTYDIARREAEHMRDFPRATIKQVGRKCTRLEAFKWESRQRLIR